MLFMSADLQIVNSTPAIRRDKMQMIKCCEPKNILSYKHIELFIINPNPEKLN